MNTNTQAISTTISFTLTATKPRVNSNFPIVTKQMPAILMASLFVISMILVPWGTAYAANTAIKWHPGHYYGIINSQKDDPKYLANVYRELNETKALRGLKIPMTWAQLERGKGDYDFRSIDRHLARLAAENKRLVIVLQTKSFKPEVALVPDYLKAEKYEGGQFAISDYGDSTNAIKGHNIKLWNGSVRYRLVQLVRALGEHYNLHPNFEGIGLEETALGQPLVAISREQFDGFYENLLGVNKKMRIHFPNTMTFQFTNYPRGMLESFVDGLKNMGTSLGGPDVRLDDPGLFLKDQPNSPDGVYSYYPKLSGIVPLTPSVMPNNYLNTRYDGAGYKPTVQQLLSFARDDLKANYIFWSRMWESHTRVLEMLNSRDQTKDPAGGLDPTCPSKYPSCAN